MARERSGVGERWVAPALVVLSGLLYTIGYVTAKLLAGRVDAMQLTFLRCALLLAAFAATIPFGPNPAAAWRRLLFPPRARDMRLAGLGVIGSSIMAILAYARMPVVEVSAIGFMGPIILTALAGPMLGERVGLRRWVAVLLGFSGMLVVLRPGMAGFQPAALLALAGQFAYAGYQIVARRLRGEADARDITLQSAIVGAAMTLPAMPFFWVAPTGLEWLMIGGFAAVQAIAQVALAMALQRAEMAGLQPWQYVKLVWALGFDLLLFGLTPDIAAALGIALILAGTALAVAKPGRGR
ncbi:MAG: DMT family transporter [Acetobacteraceae bacterium]|jgi:drug/metabolite transporter (DMT)-like permease|nr:DMT family transporter [Acetobacteraceae bacterium]